MAYGRKRNFKRKRFVKRRPRKSFKKKSISKSRYDTNGPFTLNVFPNSYTARLRYVDEVTIDAGPAGIGYHAFKANDCYKPNHNATGHQPKGFDNLMAQYDHFTVVGSRITVEDCPIGAGGVNPAYFGIYLSDNGSSVTGHTIGSTGMADLLESRTTGPYTIAGLSGQAGNRKIIRRNFSAKKFFRKKCLVGDSLYRGTVTSSPAEQAFFEVWCASIHGNDPGSIRVRVTVDYMVVFTERKYLGLS